MHFLLRRAGCAAFCIDPSNVAMRTQFGFASRRDALPYLVFRGVECVYGPPELKSVEEIVCSGLKMPVSLELAASAERIMAFRAELLTFLNNEMHKTLVYKERTLSDGVYLTKIDVKHVSDETALLEFMCRRTEDRSLLPGLVKRFLQAKLGHASLSVRFSRDARRELGEQIADALKLHYGSWLLFAPGFGELAAGGRELRMKMSGLNLRNARHPKLCDMYLKPMVGVEEWRPCVQVSKRAQIWD